MSELAIYHQLSAMTCPISPFYGHMESEAVIAMLRGRVSFDIGIEQLSQLPQRNTGYLWNVESCR
jgi:hypothetical protein